MANPLLISGAANLGKSKTGKKVLGTILSATVFLLLIIVCIVSKMISIFSNEEKISNDFDAKSTGIYWQIRETYDEFSQETANAMTEIETQLEKDYMDTRLVWEYNPETKKDELVEYEYCRANISKKYQHISTSYVMAYLSCIHSTEYLSGDIKIEEEELIDFWNTVGGLKVEESGTEEEPNFYINNAVMNPEEIAETFFADETEQQIFLESVYIIGQFIGAEDFDESIAIEFANKMDIPLYYQYQSPWGSTAYGNGTISKNGCAPTCIAMVFSYLKGKSITPEDVVKFTKNDYYVNGVGSSWSIFEACSSNWGVACTYIGTSTNSIVNALESGKPVILSMGPGIFTKSGHFIVLTGIDEDGKITVNDPNDNAKKNHAGKKFSISQIINEAKGGWSFG